MNKARRVPLVLKVLKDQLDRKDRKERRVLPVPKDLQVQQGHKAQKVRRVR